jgi:hypothetical protein
MGKISKSRHVFDNESNEIFNRLTTNNTFKNNKFIIDIFSLAMIKGKKEGIKKPLTGKRKGELNRYTMDNSDFFNYLLMAFAVEEENTIDILVEEEKCFQMAEEYAKNGLELLENDILSKNDVLLEDMEIEMLEYYDSIFKE